MVTSLTDHDGRLLRYVLDDLHYPARWWEVVTTADLYGLAPAHRIELAQLPRQLYRSFDDILAALVARATDTPAAPVRRRPRPSRRTTVRRPHGSHPGARRRRT